MFEKKKKKKKKKKKRWLKKKKKEVRGENCFEGNWIEIGNKLDSE